MSRAAHKALECIRRSKTALKILQGSLWGEAEAVGAEKPYVVSDDKIRFCRKCFRRLEPVKHLAEGAGLILDSAKRLSKERHRLVHGLVDSFTPVKDGEIKINRLLYGTHSHPVEITTTSLKEINETQQEIVALGAAASILVRELAR
jgi:hypothetical protein